MEKKKGKEKASPPLKPLNPKQTQQDARLRIPHPHLLAADPHTRHTGPHPRMQPIDAQRSATHPSIHPSDHPQRNNTPQYRTIQ
jgi:hypothetical protein